MELLKAQRFLRRISVRNRGGSLNLKVKVANLSAEV